MKLIEKKYCIILEEVGPTGRYETVDVGIRNPSGTSLEILNIKIERSDTLNGQLAFFREVIKQLEEHKNSRNEAI